MTYVPSIKNYLLTTDWVTCYVMKYSLHYKGAGRLSRVHSAGNNNKLFVSDIIDRIWACNGQDWDIIPSQCRTQDILFYKLCSFGVLYLEVSLFGFQQ